MNSKSMPIVTARAKQIFLKVQVKICRKLTTTHPVSDHNAEYRDIK